MQEMLDYVDKLDELDTSSVEPMSHIFGDQNVFREDEVTNGDNSRAMLANSAKSQRRTVITITKDHEDRRHHMELEKLNSLTAG